MTGKKKYLIEEELPDDYCTNPKKEYTLREHQKFAIDRFINKQTKGLLIYYEMGSGKTLIGLELAKLLKKPKIFLMTTNILNSNFKNEMKKFGYTFEYQFISYDSLNTQTYDFNDSLVIMDECHLFFHNVVTFKVDAYRSLMNAKDCDILLLTGTPIYKNPFELSAMFNLIGQLKNGRYNEIFPRLGKDFNGLYYNDITYEAFRKRQFIDKIRGLVCYFPGYVDNIHVFPKKEKLKYIWHKSGSTMRKNTNDYNRVFNFPYNVEITIDNLETYSPKMAYIIKFIENMERGDKIMIYSEIPEVLEALDEILSLKYQKNKDYYIAIGEDVDIINKFNADKDARIIVTNAKYGISLMGVRYVHLLESPVSVTETNQIIARATRLCSHATYEPEKRVVSTFLHVNYDSIFSKNEDYSIFYRMYIYYCLIDDFEKLLRKGSMGPVIEE